MSKLKWITKEIKLSQIMANPLNPRLINEFDKQALGRSIDKFDIVEIPVLNIIDKDKFMILSGHQRIDILREKGVKSVECRIPNRPLTESEAKEYTLIANTHAGYFNPEILELEYYDVTPKVEFVLPMYNPDDLRNSENESDLDAETGENNEEINESEIKTNVIAIQLTDKEMIEWLSLKEDIGVMNDKTVIFKLIEAYQSK